MIKFPKKSKLKLAGKIIENDLNYEEVAELLEMSKTSFVKRMNGVVDFTRSDIVLLSKVLNLSIEEVIDIFLQSNFSEREEICSDYPKRGEKK